MRTLSMLLAASATIFATTAAADTIRCPPSLDQYAGGQCGFIHRSRPESWVRGSAALDTSTGVLTFTIQLTTYSETAGPCGKPTALLPRRTRQHTDPRHDGQSGVPGRQAVGARGDPGGALQKSLPPTIALRAKSVVVAIEYSGVHLGDWNVTLQDIASAIQMLVIAVG